MSDDAKKPREKTRARVMLAGTLAAVGAWGPSLGWSHEMHFRRRPWLRNPALDVACPTCGAAAGQACDPRTLGRHSNHMSRVRAAKERSP